MSYNQSAHDSEQATVIVSRRYLDREVSVCVSRPSPNSPDGMLRTKHRQLSRGIYSTITGCAPANSRQWM